MYFTEKIGKNGMIEQLKTALENHTCLPDESLRQNLPNPNVAAHRIRSKFQHVENQTFFPKIRFFLSQLAARFLEGRGWNVEKMKNCIYKYKLH